MKMRMGFGQIFKEEEVPFVCIENPELLSHKISDDAWILVLKESVRSYLKDGSNAQAIGINCMNSRHYSYIEHFINAVSTNMKVRVHPDWILYRE